MSIHIKHKLMIKMRSLDNRLWDLWKKSRWATHLSWIKIIFHSDMIDLLAIIGLAFRQCPLKNWRPPLLCNKKTKWQTDQVPRAPSPSPALLPNLWFFRKKRKSPTFPGKYRGSFQIKILLGEQNNTVWTPNSKIITLKFND